jgi:hypothetical protein
LYPLPLAESWVLGDDIPVAEAVFRADDEAGVEESGSFDSDFMLYLRRKALDAADAAV